MKLRKLLAVLLSAAVTGIYREGAAAKADDALVWIFSREKIADSFRRIMPLFFVTIGISAAGLIAFSKIFSTILFAESYYTAWQYMPLLISATVFSSLVTFMGSVYLVDKKSVHSFITSMIGALINIAFNLILIPTPLGANGAALATFFSYFIVFIIRAVNTRKFIRFPLHTPKLIANTAIIGTQTVFMIFELKFWIPIQIIAIAVIFIVNAKPILGGIMKILHRR